MKVIATIEIEVHAPISGDPVGATHRRMLDMQDWIKRHQKDIESVVCSPYDNLSWNVDMKSESQDD